MGFFLLMGYSHISACRIQTFFRLAEYRLISADAHRLLSM
jgi:hypothetical protein